MKRLDMLYQIALEVPKVSKQRMVACLVRKKRVISIGIAQKKTHPLQARFCKHEKAIYLHAEISAIVNAREDVRGADLYIMRVRPDGERGLAKPCRGCARAIKHYGVRNVYYSV